MDKFGISLNNPLFFVPSDSVVDISAKYSVPIPRGWSELRGSEWVNIGPIEGTIQRQGWKIHVSSELKTANQVLAIVSNICYKMKVTFKHLSTEHRFIARNGKMVNRGFSGKFITCYPDKSILKRFLDVLENALSNFKGPYILSDKRWKHAPIYLRYGVFRTVNSKEPDVDIGTLLINGQKVLDKRDPWFNIPKGLTVPPFLQKWIDAADDQGDAFPFEILGTLRFSNNGGIYSGTMNVDGNTKGVIVHEARPFTGIDSTGRDSVTDMISELTNLNKLKSIDEVPHVIWQGKLWEHSYFVEAKRSGVPLNRWVTQNYPIYPDIRKDYLPRAYEIAKKIVNVIQNAHQLRVYHQDIHPGNVIIDKDDNIAVIDWEKSVFNQTSKRNHKVAAPGFRAWGRKTPEQIDWYGVYQLVQHLLYPVTQQADLVYDYSSQNRHIASEIFKTSALKQVLKEYFDLLNKLRALSGETIVLDQNKILYPVFPDDLPTDKTAAINEFSTKFYYGMTEVLKRWHNSQRHFPVHFYGNKVNQGVAFSDLATTVAIVKSQDESFLSDYDMQKLAQKVKEEAIEHFQFRRGNASFGLLNGESGSMWLLSLLGNKNIGSSFGRNFVNYIKSTNCMRLYDGVAGILLTGIYFDSINELSNEQANVLKMSLKNFSKKYLRTPEDFSPIGKGKSKTNDPDETQGGLLYGHAGYGWLFAEAYRMTHDSIFKTALNFSVQNELSGYASDTIGSLQYSQGIRVLPYLATGSAGLGILLALNHDIVDAKYLDTLPKLLKALQSNFCVYPGLFNGMAGIKLAKYCIEEAQNKSNKDRSLIEYIESLQPYLIGIGKGYVLAGDDGSRITTDVASGAAGVMFGLLCIKQKNFSFIPRYQLKGGE